MRRRVGMSELILRAMLKLSGLYFPGKTAEAPLQLREFIREAGRGTGE